MLLGGADKQDVCQFKTDALARERLLHWLETKGMNGISCAEIVGDHYIAACAAVLGAWQWGLGKSVWRYKSYPSHHPYDFGC